MIKWRWRPFEGLTTRDLYAIFELRIEVFTVEQNCVYQDADGKDFKAWHLLGWEDDVLIAYIRLLPAGVSYDIPSLGRVAIKAIARGRGLGKLIMQKALEKSDELWPGQAMRISAQAYLRKFYEDLGFSVIGEPYLEDDIPHFAMIRDVLFKPRIQQQDLPVKSPRCERAYLENPETLDKEWRPLQD